MKRVVCLLSLLLIIQQVADGEEMRTWTSKKGDTVEAMYIRMFAGGKVILETSDGKQLTVPVDGLCAKDQEYLASKVPPQLDIEVDIDTDSDTSYSSYDYERKKEVVKGKVVVKKTNREPCNQTLTVGMYVFAKRQRGDDLWLISKAEKKISFADGVDQHFFKCPAAETEYTNTSYSDQRGYRYEGYLVMVEDAAGNILAVESNRGEIESHCKAIRGAEVNTEFDGDFDRMSRKRTSSW